MKFKKLDARGFSHDVILVLFVAIFAISGVAYLVASHADSCTPVSGAVSVVSSATSAPTSCQPVSTPVKPVQPTPPIVVPKPIPKPALLLAKCSISGSSVTPKYGQILRPQLTITNIGNVAFTPNVQNTLAIHGSRTTSSIQTLSLPSLSPSKAEVGSQTLTAYSVPYSSSAARYGVYTVKSISGPTFTCTSTFVLPTAR